MLVSRAGADAAAAAGTLVVSSHVSPLRLVARFPSQCSTVSGICALDDDCVLLACGALRALRLSSAQLCARDPSPLEDVWNVAFDAATDTLLLALKAKARGSRAVAWLVSLQRVSDEWREVQRMQTEFALSDWVGISFAGDSRALCGQQFKDRLYAFDVSADHRLQPVGTVVLEAAFCRFACTRLGGDSLVAFTDDESSCVSVQRLMGDGAVLRLEPLARTQLENAWHILFRGDQLLVATVTNSVVSFHFSGAGLIGRRDILGAKAGVRVYTWCLAGNRLVVWDFNSEDLLLYE